MSFGATPTTAAATTTRTLPPTATTDAATTTTAPSGSGSASVDPSIATNPDISIDATTTPSSSIADTERMCTLGQTT